MGRRSRQKSSAKRETFDFPNDSELLREYTKPKPAYRPIVTHTAPKALTPIEDRRTYHPQGKARPARSLNKSQHRLAIATSKPAHVRSAKRSVGQARLPHAVQFEAPKQVLVCIRRKARKEVLFALRKTGKGARAKRHRQSYYSNVRC